MRRASLIVRAWGKALDVATLLLFVALIPVQRLMHRHSHLGDRTFFDKASFPWVPHVESEWQTMRRELETVLRFADDTEDGAVSADGRASGAYAHGFFSDDRQRAAWLHRLGAAPSDLAYEAEIERVLDRLADHLERHIDLDDLLALAR